ncbi:hypothetical protein VTN00DRAFT_6482 [Thermoascus crustaceus]|uniref:uncharacterized protein n=1 Tax=Thermoascus crustaceus TaxID=5088 RepID=UPI00374287F4
MVFSNLLQSVVSAGLLASAASSSALSARNASDLSPSACYGATLPSIPPSADNRTVPWGSPSVHFSSLNGTLSTCCDSLDQVRDALDEIDSKLLDLLNQRAAYVREATRFKSTRASVNVPSRNREVVEQAKEKAFSTGLPTIRNESAVETSHPCRRLLVSLLAYFEISAACATDKGAVIDGSYWRNDGEGCTISSLQSSRVSSTSWRLGR